MLESEFPKTADAIGGSESQSTISCSSVWKVYPLHREIPREIHAAIAGATAESLSRAEIAVRFGCIAAVAGVSFSVTPGEIFCIMGLSGSGKSTLLRHLNRLIEPTAGTILINGGDISRKSAQELREIRAEKIGMVFQDVALWPHLSVQQNVAYGLAIRGVSKTTRREVAARMLDLVQLTGWEERYPDELSGGMKQRVGLARALAIDPDILLLDEPFSALDPLIRQELQNEFLKITGIVNKTAVFITHDLHEAIRLGDRIAVMKDGRFVQVGTPEEIVMQPKDSYVADFVKGISKLNLVRAQSIMEPMSAHALQPFNAGSCPSVPPHANLDTLIDIAARTDDPIVVVDGESSPLGIITKRALLRGIQGAR